MLTPSTTPTNATFSPSSFNTPDDPSQIPNTFSPLIQESHASTPFSFEGIDGFGVHTQHEAQMSTSKSMDNIISSSLQDTSIQFQNVLQNHFPKTSSPGSSFNGLQPAIDMQTPPPSRESSEKKRPARSQSVILNNSQALGHLSNGMVTLADLDQPTLLSTSLLQQPLPPSFSDAQTQSSAASWTSNDTNMGSFWNIHENNNVMYDSCQDFSQNSNTSYSGSFGESFSQQQINPSLLQQSMLSYDQTNDTYQQTKDTYQQTKNMFDQSKDWRSSTPEDKSNITTSIPSMPGSETISQSPSENTCSTSFPSYPKDHDQSQDSPSAISFTNMARPALKVLTQNRMHPPVNIPSVTSFPALVGRDGVSRGKEMIEKPMLRRSNTFETQRPQSMYGSFGELSRSNTSGGIPRKASPFKRTNRNSMASLASIFESTPTSINTNTTTNTTTNTSNRRSMILTVDDQGIARAEKQVLEQSPSKSLLMARYPSLWDDSDSDSDADNDKPASPSSSCIQSPQAEQDPSTQKSIAETLAALEGVTLPRATSSASIKATPTKNNHPLCRPSSVRKSYSAGHSRRNTVSFSIGSPSDAEHSGNSTTADEESGNASVALRKAFEKRQQLREAAKNQPRPRALTKQRPKSTYIPRNSSFLGLGASSFDRAPMQNFNAPFRQNPLDPCTDMTAAMSSISRCICNHNVFNGQVMLQCSFCHFWSHAACAGFSPNDALPPNFACNFCIAAMQTGSHQQHQLHPHLHHQQQQQHNLAQHQHQQGHHQQQQQHQFQQMAFSNGWSTSINPAF